MTKNIKRKGVIIAAGIGTRLGDSGQNQAKPMISVAGKPLLIRAIKGLEIAGCHEIIIILGWQAEKIEKEISEKYSGSSSLRFVFNKFYRLKNGISVLNAKSFVEEEFILTMADHIFDKNIMRLISDHHPPPLGATLCVDYKLDTIFDMDDATKVFAEGPIIRAIGKNLKKYNCIDSGLFIGTTGLFDAISRIYEKTGDASLSEGVQLLAKGGKMEALDIKNAFWQDVDTLEMKEHAKGLLLRRGNDSR
ncbi:sugar phosphate nucleotidyltransferase [Thermodesulfobacteriota bacterium]